MQHFDIPNPLTVSVQMDCVRPQNYRWSLHTRPTTKLALAAPRARCFPPSMYHLQVQRAPRLPPRFLGVGQGAS
jgi:hypothetical protein